METGSSITLMPTPSSGMSRDVSYFFRKFRRTRICIRSPISLNRDKREIRVSKNEKGAFSFIETRILHHL